MSVRYNSQKRIKRRTYFHFLYYCFEGLYVNFHWSNYYSNYYWSVRVTWSEGNKNNFLSMARNYLPSQYEYKLRKNTVEVLMGEIYHSVSETSDSKNRVCTSHMNSLVIWPAPTSLIWISGRFSDSEWAEVQRFVFSLENSELFV